VTPTQVRRASIDRMVWAPDAWTRPTRLRAGEVDRCPVARSRTTTLHLAVDLDGAPAFVLRGPCTAERAEDLRFLASLGPAVGAAVPDLRRHTPDELWLDRQPWTTGTARPAAVDRYVTASVGAALTDGTIIGTGEVHATDDGQVGGVDLVVARLLEVDERAELTALWCSLVLLDPVGVTDAASRLCGTRTVGLPGAADRAVLSLAAEWTPVSLGLSLHHVACATVAVGPRSEPLVLLADELLHRLDLAHRNHAPVEPLTSPSRALQLLHREAARA
jgi:hypothetical protein